MDSLAGQCIKLHFFDQTTGFLASRIFDLEQSRLVLYLFIEDPEFGFIYGQMAIAGWTIQINRNLALTAKTFRGAGSDRFPLVDF